jgi:LAS superfamily LD-carboxypeptidase LdcB
MKKDVGNRLVLTSGVRSIVKQTLLFLNKAEKHRGNLSLASRSLAPPGFSYHGIGDFDVGQIGYGIANFTERFATTDVFNRLQKLEYVKLRYSSENHLGVRFEPWHIHVASLKF